MLFFKVPQITLFLFLGGFEAFFSNVENLWKGGFRKFSASGVACQNFRLREQRSPAPRGRKFCHFPIKHSKK